MIRPSYKKLDTGKKRMSVSVKIQIVKVKVITDAGILQRD